MRMIAILVFNGFSKYQLQPNWVFTGKAARQRRAFTCALRERSDCPQAGLVGRTQVTEINGTAGVELAAMLSGPASAAIRRRGGFEF